MRTPGRCTNHDHCWLGNARRDVWVAVDQAFLCPVCGTKLIAPPVQTMARKGMARTAAAGASVLVLAALAGFAVVRITGSLVRPPPGQIAATAAMKPARRLSATQPATAHAAVQPPAASVLATKTITPVAPPGLETTGETAARMLLTQAKLAAPAGRAPAQPRLILPVSFGRPASPEDAGAAPAGAWHRHAPVSHRATGFMPGPGEARLIVASADDAAADDAAGGGRYAPLVQDTLMAPAQGDSDDATSHLDAGIDVPVAAAVRPAGPDMVLREAVQVSNELPRDSAGTPGDAQPDAAPDDIPAMAATRGSVTVAALGASVVVHIFGGNPMPSLPPERIDPAQAAQADVASNPLVKLVALPPAHPDALPKPKYPAVYAEQERPGQVRVGCTITTRGTPSACQILDEHGGARFANSVITWLQSGDVRYRPGIDAGRIVPTPREYKVRFVPE